jgi:NAD(P)-dependent dehydrogenase (short-subunit alcohol dehydrogenase family)
MGSGRRPALDEIAIQAFAMEAALMQGKTVVMTGATSGIGEIAALKLAEAGARILFVARDEGRAASLLARLARTNAWSHQRYLADLTSLRATERVGAEIVRDAPQIDVLINNAGAIFSARQRTVDGLERTFALNHMSYFVLTQAVLPSLRAAAASRIVNTGSAAHLRAALDFDDLQGERNYGAMRAYSRSKLCNILFTRELARRLKETGVTANCLHPGFVATRFADEAGGLIGGLARVAKRFAISPDKGAETIVFLASAPEAAQTSGAYFFERRAVSPSAPAQDDETAANLWRVSENLVERVHAS